MCPARFPVNRVALAVALRVGAVSPMALAVACAGVIAGTGSAPLAAEERNIVANMAVDGRAEWRTIQTDNCSDDEHAHKDLNDFSRADQASAFGGVDGRADWASAADRSCSSPTSSPRSTQATYSKSRASSKTSRQFKSKAVTAAAEELDTSLANQSLSRPAMLPAVLLPTALGAPDLNLRSEPTREAAIEQADSVMSSKASSAPRTPDSSPSPSPEPMPLPEYEQLGVTVREADVAALRSEYSQSGVDLLRRWLGSLDLHVDPQAWPCLDATSLRENIRAQLERLVSIEAAGMALGREAQSRKGNLRWLLDTMAIRNNDPASLEHGVSKDWAVVWLDCGPEGVHLASLLKPISKVGGIASGLAAGLAGVPDIAVTTAPGVSPAAALPDIDLGSPSNQSESTAASSPAESKSSGSNTIASKESAAKSTAPKETRSGLFIVDDAAPAGFEALAKPQVVWVDVWFNGRNMGATEIKASADEIVFSEPVKVAGMLSDIEDPETLIEWLSTALPTNADKVCFGRDDPLGCGRVEGTPVALIYDEADLKVNLFLSSALQSLQSSEGARYLDPPETRNSSILSMGAVVSELQGEDSHVDLFARAISSYGRGYVSAEVDHRSRSEQTRLNELKLTHFIEGHEVNVGTYGWSPGGAWTHIDLLGIGFATSYKTRVDIEQAFSTELLVFLQERAVVQLLVDGRVYSGDSYAAGNQVLDTRALPDGSYPVEIRILDSGGAVRSETQTFTKSAQIPPSGETVFSATAGLPLRYQENTFAPETSDPPVAGFSVAHRINDQSATRLGMLQIGEHSFLQSNYVFLGNSFSFQGQATFGEGETLAANLLASYDTRLGLFTFSADHFNSDLSEEEDEQDQNDELNLFPVEQSRWTLAASRAVGDLAIRASIGQKLDTDDDPQTGSRTEYRLNLRKPLFRSRHLRGYLEAGWQRDELRDLATLQLDVFFDQANWTARAGTDLHKSSRSDWQAGVSANLGYRESRESFDWGADAYARMASTESAGARVFLDHPLYRATASSDVSRASSGDLTRNSIATASAHIGFDGGGAALGGSEYSQAGVIIAIQGEPAGAAFDVMVNDVRRSSGEIGSNQFVGLQPFETYSVKIVPRDVISNGIGNDVFEFTLYPGTVERIDIVAMRQILLIASLVDEQGDPMSNAVVQLEGNPAVTDADGILQAEVSPGSVLQVTGVEGQRCTFTVPDAPIGKEIHVHEQPLLCKADPGSLLSVSQQE